MCFHNEPEKHHKTSINNYIMWKILHKCMSINQINGFCIALFLMLYLQEKDSLGLLLLPEAFDGFVQRFSIFLHIFVLLSLVCLLSIVDWICIFFSFYRNAKPLKKFTVHRANMNTTICLFLDCLSGNKENEEIRLDFEFIAVCWLFFLIIRTIHVDAKSGQIKNR